MSDPVGGRIKNTSILDVQSTGLGHVPRSQKGVAARGGVVQFKFLAFRKQNANGLHRQRQFGRCYSWRFKVDE